jgi:hypothetical protein
MRHADAVLVYPELQKLNFLLFALAIFVVGTHILPGMDYGLVSNFFKAARVAISILLVSSGALPRSSRWASCRISTRRHVPAAVAVIPELKQIQQESEKAVRRSEVGAILQLRWLSCRAAALSWHIQRHPQTP